MLKLLLIKNPVKGIVSLEFISPRHINANIGLISTESGPYVSSTRAERDGGPPIITHHKMRLAQQAANYPNGERSAIGRLIAIPQRSFQNRYVIP